MSLLINEDHEALVMRDVLDEIQRSMNRQYPMSHLRRTALIGEEFGEAIKEALDLTRLPHDQIPRRYSRDPMLGRLRRELIHTAAVTLRALFEMEREDKR